MFDLSYNSLTGTISQDFVESIPGIQFFSVSENSFSGNISSLFANYPEMEGFDVANNHFTLSLPFLNHSTILTYFNARNNYFTGTVPHYLLNTPALGDVDFSANHLSGWVRFGNFCFTSYLNASFNYFSGQLTSLFQLDNATAHELLIIENIILSHNSFSGTIPAVWSFPFLDVLELSNNQLTGPLIVSNTTTFLAASTNCFQGSLPVELCQSRKCEVIILNGLSSSTNCQIPIFPNTIIDTFTTKFTIDNGLPDCLFQLPKLQISQLSGNGLTGTIPAINNQTGSLYNLDLSHNTLTGTIPDSIQYKSNWESLDLSYNLLTGELLNDFASFSLSSRNQSLTLTVNRLSGNIPSSSLSANDIDILDGNMFTCNYDSNFLPSHDPHANNYSCGSDLVNLSIYFWLCTGGVLVLFVIILGCLMFFTTARESVQSVLSSMKLLISWYNYFHNYCENEFYQKEMKNRPSSSAVLKTDQNQILLLRFFNQIIRRTSLFLTVALLVVLLPSYGVLSLDYSTYQNRYAWTVSGLFLSGEESTVVLFVELFLFILFTTIVFICYF
jgi:hypothetical protein